MAQAPGEQVQVQIRPMKKNLVGQFCNLVMFIITRKSSRHTLSMCFECAARQAGLQLIVTPAHAKRILRALLRTSAAMRAIGPSAKFRRPTPVPMWVSCSSRLSPIAFRAHENPHSVLGWAPNFADGPNCAS